MSQATLVLEKLVEFSRQIDQCLELLKTTTPFETYKLEIKICTYAQEITIGELFKNKNHPDILNIIQEGTESIREIYLAIQTNLVPLKEN